MRDILFRGKRIDNGEWVHGDIAHHDGKISYVGQHPADGSMVVHDLIPETVGQYTGLTDKNGQKIFEGDICHCVSRMDAGDMVVIFEEGEFRMVLCECYKNYITGAGYFAIRNFEKEIIGNIHDNPELLEVVE